MNFAPVLPLSMYRSCDHGDYHMVQAHLFGRHTSAAAEWFYQRGAAANSPMGRSHTVILDCGTWELKKANVEALFQVAARIKPDIIVCPDRFQLAAPNIEMFRSYAEMCAELAPLVMMVPHGNCLTQWCQNAANLTRIAKEMKIPYCYGVPKVLDSYDGGRYAAVAFLDEYLIDDEEVHLLGIWDTPATVRMIGERFPWIKGVDSTWPYDQAENGKVISMYSYGSKHGVQNWDQEMEYDLITLTGINIACMREAMACGQIQLKPLTGVTLS